MFGFHKEPTYVPRTSVLIKPKPAFIFLVNAYEVTQKESLLLSDENLDGDDSFIYLLPEFLNRKGMRDYLRKHAKPLLKHLLQLYIEDKKHWPKKLSFDEFELLFSWEPVLNVNDISAW